MTCNPLTYTPTGVSGGLYPGGSNVRPPAHEAAGVAIAGQIVPRDAGGSPSPTRKIGMISVGMSNTQMEFGGFKVAADTDPLVNDTLVVVNGAAGGGVIEAWVDPETTAFENGFAVRWLIERQLNGDLALNYDANRGPVTSSYLSWGPYLWIDGLNPRSDGRVWQISYVTDRDCTHPSPAGIAYVTVMMMEFFKSDSTAHPWFLNSAGPTPTATPIPTHTGTPGPSPTATVTPRPPPGGHRLYLPGLFKTWAGFDPVAEPSRSQVRGITAR